MAHLQEPLPRFDRKNTELRPTHNGAGKKNSRKPTDLGSEPGPFFIDVLGGVNSAQVRFRSDQPGVTQTFNGLHPAFGINAGMRLKEKWTVNVQVMYNATVKGNERASSEQVFVDSYTRVDTVPGGATHTIDTVKRSLIYEHALNMPVKQSYGAGIGVGFIVFEGPRFSIEGNLYLDLNFSKYTLQQHSGFRPDSIYEITPKQTYGGPWVPPYSYTNPNLESYVVSAAEEKKKAFNLGIRPGLLFCYRLNGRLSLVLRGGYGFGLMQRRGSIGNVEFKLHENNVLGNLGLRIHF